jgi:FtsZ-interacting cell division protein ZipA
MDINTVVTIVGVILLILLIVTGWSPSQMCRRIKALEDKLQRLEEVIGHIEDIASNANSNACQAIREARRPSGRGGFYK